MANLATGLFRGFPVGGGMSQTAINDMGGATSPLSLIVTSGAIALTLLFFAGLFHDLPEPVLGAIVLMAAKHLVKVEELKVVRAASRSRVPHCVDRSARRSRLRPAEWTIAGRARIADRADRAGCAAAGRRSGARSSRPFRQSRAPVRARGRRPERWCCAAAVAWVYFNADYLRRQILEFVERAPEPVRVVVVDCSMVPAIDLNAAGSLRALARTLSARGIGSATRRASRRRSRKPSCIRSRGRSGIDRVPSDCRGQPHPRGAPARLT